MRYYFGSDDPNLKGLIYFKEKDKNPNIIFTDSEITALFSCIFKGKFFISAFLDEKGENVIFTEFYENMTADLFDNKSGYIYTCEDFTNSKKDKNLNGAYKSNPPLVITNCEKKDNIYKEIIKYQKSGNLEIIKYKSQSSEFYQRQTGKILKLALKYNLSEKEKEILNLIKNV